MTKHEGRMTTETQILKDDRAIGHSFVIPSSFAIRHSSRHRAREMMKRDGNPKRSKSAGSLLLHAARSGMEHSLELPLLHRLPEQFYYRSNISRVPRRSHLEASAH